MTNIAAIAIENGPVEILLDFPIIFPFNMVILTIRMLWDEPSTSHDLRLVGPMAGQCQSQHLGCAHGENVLVSHGTTSQR